MNTDTEIKIKMKNQQQQESLFNAEDIKFLSSLSNEDIEFEKETKLYFQKQLKTTQAHGLLEESVTHFESSLKVKVEVQKKEELGSKI